MPQGQQASRTGASCRPVRTYRPVNPFYMSFQERIHSSMGLQQLCFIKQLVQPSFSKPQEVVKETKVHVNLGEVVGKLSLDTLPPAVWQELSTPVDKLATEVERLKKRGHAAPYVLPAPALPAQ